MGALDKFQRVRTPTLILFVKLFFNYYISYSKDYLAEEKNYLLSILGMVPRFEKIYN